LKKDQYSAINPNQTIPTLEDDTLDHPIIFEGGAIIDHLLHIQPNQLTPPWWTLDNWAKHNLYKYWCIATLDGRFLSKMTGSGAIGNKLNKTSKKIYESLIVPFLTKDLQGTLYINGDEFTATDLFLGYTLFLAENLKLIDHDSVIGEYYKRLSSREAFRRSFPSSLNI